MGAVAVFPPRRLKRMLRNAEIFEMLSDEEIDRVLHAGRIVCLGCGDRLFEAGDASDRVHLVLDGALEILRATPDHPQRVPVAYISPGEIIGDMALLTGSPRRSGSRIPERLLVWTLTRETFEKLANEIPGYWRSLAKVFARRQETIITRMRRQSQRKELSGKLAYFDLPTVVQTLVTSSQTGILTLMDEDEETVAEVVILDGCIERARTGLLEGEDAFHELFLANGDGRFFFRTVADPDPETVSQVPIHPTSINLLMEAVRRLDRGGLAPGRAPRRRQGPTSPRRTSSTGTRSERGRSRTRCSRSSRRRGSSSRWLDGFPHPRTRCFRWRWSCTRPSRSAEGREPVRVAISLRPSRPEHHPGTVVPERRAFVVAARPGDLETEVVEPRLDLGAPAEVLAGRVGPVEEDLVSGPDRVAPLHLEIAGRDVEANRQHRHPGVAAVRQVALEDGALRPPTHLFPARLEPVHVEEEVAAGSESSPARAETSSLRVRRRQLEERVRREHDQVESLQTPGVEDVLASQVNAGRPSRRRAGSGAGGACPPPPRSP
jgi:CRP-like cAMP-binding protein